MKKLRESKNWSSKEASYYTHTPPFLLIYESTIFDLFIFINKSDHFIRTK